ncbi:MAG TPA: class I SAM-dependent methyltransferase [Anaerolineales bacterium]|nr:class I SAM-dependent methyltransferase [Anaerolineales bacterium]
MTHFDEEAKKWDDIPVRAERARAVAEAIREQLPLTPSTSALEYGCGTGLLSFALQPYLGSITLADSSTGMLEVLRDKIAASGAKNMQPVRLDLASDPLPAEKYDLIYLLMTLHHIPDTATLLRKFHALLHPGGHLCIADLDKEDGSFHDYEFVGHLGFERKALEKTLQQAGFAEIRYTTPFAMQKNGRTYPLFLAIAERPAHA